MGTGIDELDQLVEGGKSAAADVKGKWMMKLGGVAVAGIGALVLRSAGESPEIRYAGIGILVVGVLMILGTDGIKWTARQIWSAGKNKPRTTV
jgi:hypothetical protein